MDLKPWSEVNKNKIKGKLSTYDIRTELEVLLEDGFLNKMATEAELFMEDSPFSKGGFNYSF